MQIVSIIYGNNYSSDYCYCFVCIYNLRVINLFHNTNQNKAKTASKGKSRLRYINFQILNIELKEYHHFLRLQSKHNLKQS